MNLNRLLAERAEAGNPIGVALIGAGKFGTMFLAQSRRTPGLHVAGLADLSAGRALSALDAVGWPAEAAPRRVAGSRHGGAIGHRDRGCGGPDRGARDRRGDRQHRQPGGRSGPRLGLPGAWQASGQCHRRGRCAGRPGAGETVRRGRAGLFAGLWRPAGADRRAGRLGPCQRISGRLRRQGHQIPAGLPRLDAGHGVGALRAESGTSCRRRPQSEDVQLVPGRHQIGHRDGRGRQCLRADAAARRSRIPALWRRRTGSRC